VLTPIEKGIWQDPDIKIIAVSSIIFTIAFILEHYFDSKLSLVLFLLVAVIAGWKIVRGGITSLFKKSYSIDLLVTIASAGAFLIGSSSEGAAVMLLFFVAEFLEEHASDRARRSVGELMKLAPESAAVKQNGTEITMHVHAINVGDILVVRPGDRIALDGIIVRGASSVNQAPITGESTPVEKEVGDDVFAGTINQEGYLEIRVTKTCDETMLSKIVEMVSVAQGNKSQTEQFIDRFSNYYTPVIILTALAVSTIPPLLFGGNLSDWVYRALILLVISCPCALAISTPVSMVSGITSGARNGVLIKGSNYVEDISKIKVIAFDKTGTLTEGKLHVEDILPINDYDYGTLLEIAASLETFSQHPIANAIMKQAKKENINPCEITDFKATSGAGVIGVCKEKQYYLGNKKLFDKHQIPFPSKKVSELEAQGKTVIVLGSGTEAIGIISVMDSIRPAARWTVERLKKMGLRIVMLTGDNEQTAKAITKKIGVDEYHASLLPEDKVRAVEDLNKQYGRVIMIGDGVNDAPALAKATVGIAMGAGGSDVALETADIALIHDDLSKIPYLFHLSKKTLGVVKQNITLSIIVKGGFAILAIPGYITLWMAVGFGDMGLSLFVILNSIRLSLIKAREMAIPQ
jgi:Cd2+/Zn2+-exporting ATPase